MMLHAVYMHCTRVLHKQLHPGPCFCFGVMLECLYCLAKLEIAAGVVLQVLGARDLSPKARAGLPDPYCKILCGQAQHRTATQRRYADCAGHAAAQQQLRPLATGKRIKQRTCYCRCSRRVAVGVEL
jgi:hypothetical protein